VQTHREASLDLVHVTDGLVKLNRLLRLCAGGAVRWAGRRHAGQATSSPAVDAARGEASRLVPHAPPSLRPWSPCQPTCSDACVTHPWWRRQLLCRQLDLVPLRPSGRAVGLVSAREEHSAVERAAFARTRGRNVLKPRIRSRCPRKRTLTRWMTPLVSILAGVQRLSACARGEKRGQSVGTQGVGSLAVPRREHALLRLELLHDLQELVVHALVVRERLLHRPGGREAGRAKVRHLRHPKVPNSREATHARPRQRIASATAPRVAHSAHAAHGTRAHLSGGLGARHRPRPTRRRQPLARCAARSATHRR